jgi:hypothetical protein
MENTLRAFILSLAASLFMVWFYFGFPPLGHALLPLAEGSLLNTLIKIAAIPLTATIIAGGGLAAATSLASATEVEATREAERCKLALLAPAGVVWVAFVATMAYPLGPIGNAVVVCASMLAILRIPQNAIALGVFRASSGSADAAMGESLGASSNG